MRLSIHPLTGSALQAALDGVARLRIQVFRDWPYIYDGDLDYERRYLQDYADSDRALVVGAWDGDKLVGASTGMPMTDHDDAFAEAFAGTDLDLSQIFYCAESVLLPAYHGQGAGHRFFDEREAHARKLGLTYSSFCSVIRPEDHPLRPADTRSLHPFWRKRGYAPLPGVTAEFTWKDLDQSEETAKSLQFWGRAL